MNQIIIDKRTCNICSKGENAPVFLYINEPSIPIGAFQITEAFEKINTKSNYIFMEIYVDDWDVNLSPWATSIANGREFSGKAKQTLFWINEKIIPFIDNTFKEHEEIFITGYSLSGLFALWSLYNSDTFDGGVCCSGSLWYPKWDVFMQANHLKKSCLVYLSLGGKEETTKNPSMASVGINTRKQLAILKKDPLIKSTILEMNPGGHFSDTATRVAKGINWILKEKEYLLKK